MKNLSQNKWRIFKGAGLLLGILLSIVAALAVFTLSDSFAAAISSAFPIGVFSGISLEQKFQRKNEQTDPKKTKMMIHLILFGFIIFVALYFII
jgi:hypothetical protein